MALGHGHGSMSLSMKFIRLLIVLFNLAFIVVGIVLLAVGVYVLKDPKMKQLAPLLNPDIVSTYSQSLSNFQVFALALIVIGGFLLVVGFLGNNVDIEIHDCNFVARLGCCGAVKGFRFLHILYAIIVGTIIIAEIAIVATFLIYQNRFREQLVDKLQQSIALHYVGISYDNSTVNNPVSLSWDFAQFNLQCCGAIGSNDYSRTTAWDRKNPYQPALNLTIPFTCCPINASQSWTQLPTDFSSAGICATTGVNGFKQGCYDRLVDVLTAYKKSIIIGCVVIGVVEILAFAFALLLYFRKEDYDTL